VLGANIYGPGDITIGESARFIGQQGRLTGPGRLRFEPGSRGDLGNGGGGLTFDNRPIDNAGTIYIYSAISLNNGSNLTNSQFLFLEGGASLSDNSGAASLIANGGFLQNIGSASVHVPVVNTGEILVNNGSLTIDLLKQTAGSTQLAPSGKLTVSFGLDLEGGILEGDGSITGNVKNVAGTVAPGGLADPYTEGPEELGTLTINGNYLQKSGGNLNIAIQNPTLLDQLNVSGQAILDGNVTILWKLPDPDYIPQPGDTFPFLFGSPRVSTFYTVTIPNQMGGPPAVGYGPFVVYAPSEVYLLYGLLNTYGPVVTSISSSSGNTLGGNQITISGQYFTDAAGVRFGSVPATDYTINSDTSVTVTVPPQAVGTVDVRVVSDTGGLSNTSLQDQYTYTLGPAPVISGVSPNTGNLGTPLTISGSNFAGVTAVSFNNNPALAYFVNSNSQLVAWAPTLSPGTVDVQVTNFGGQSTPTSADQFTTLGPPVVTGFENNGNAGYTSGGASVTITGSNFADASGVFFGTTPAPSFLVDPTYSRIIVTTPPHAAGIFDVTVVTPSGTSALSSADQFTYVAANAPAVSGVVPNQGSSAGGTVVTISGSDFGGATQVLFGGVPASFFQVAASGTIIAVAPPLPVSSGVDVTVVTYTGVSAVSSMDHFQVTAGTLPAVSSLSISSGSSVGGTVVTIFGSNFTGATGVTFGGVPAANFTILADGAIAATSPPHASSAQPVDVQVTTYAGTSPAITVDHFTYTQASQPTFTSISPTTGTAAGGTLVTLIGAHFTAATGVFFGGVPALDFTVLSDTAILATSPPQTAGGAATVDITVTTPDWTSSTSSADQFTYTAPPVPTVSGVSPSSSTTAGGTLVFMTGTGFTGATAVAIGSLLIPDFTIQSDTQIAFMAPPYYAGTYDVTVTTPGGVSVTSGNDRFSYTAVAPPAVNSVTGGPGSTAGGTPITISGTNFTGATSVLFGTVPALTFTVLSDTSILAIAPPQATGTVDITVTTYTGTSPVGTPDQLTYQAAAAPTVSGVTPNAGSTGGGTVVYISGTHFTGATDVRFGGVSALSFSINSDTQITAIAPPQAPNPLTIDITVVTFSGTSTTSTNDHFTYVLASAPAVAGVSPSSGSTAGGNSVVITGTYFSGATAVLFGSLNALSFTVNGDTSITAIPPPEAAGVVNVRVQTPSGLSNIVSADQYTFAFPQGNPVPSVTAVSPATGSVAGGQVVTITGSSLAGATAVKFGTVAAASFTVNSDTSITAVAPAGQAAGQVDITVTTPAGTSATSSADAFTYLTAPAPTVSNLSLNTGSTAGGLLLTISGSGFTGVTQVLFGTVSASFTFNSDTSITVITPPQAVGTIDVTVVTPSGTSSLVSGDRFTYTAAAPPTISGLVGNTGSTAGGTTVVINGTNFTGAWGVFFGGVAALSFTINSATQITAVSPPQAVGTIDVQVSTYSATSALTTNDRFSYTLAAVASVSSVSPATGSTAGGYSATISGSGFTGAIAVFFGTVSAAFTVNSDMSITATVPPEAVGQVHVLVTTYSGTSLSTSNDLFTYTLGPTPTISSLSATSGNAGGGNSVTISGTGFTGAITVLFDTTPANFTINSDTSITVTVPAHAPGTINVTVSTYAATSSPVTYTYNAALPTVTGVVPTSGSSAGGTLVTILGSNFTGATSVLFGGVAALDFTVVSDTAVLATAPPGSTGTIDIQVVTYIASAISSADHFTYTAAPVPTITMITGSPGGTGGGNTVVITGTNLDSVSQVFFGAISALSFTVNSSTQITAVSPPQTAGTYDITVQSAGGTSAVSSADRFVYNAALPPSVSGVSPGSGSAAGGITVTLSGSNFTGATAVFFGSISALSFTVNSDTSITAVVPSQVVGTVDVTVQTPSGTSVVSANDHFQYTTAAVPQITAISPSTGSAAGGTVVYITGVNFTAASSVMFGSTSAAFTVLSDTLISAVVPAGTGSVTVQVTTPGGTAASPSSFTYSSVPAPTLTTVTPTSGSTAGGDSVVLIGSGFTGATTVLFGTVTASFTINSGTSITAIVPAQTPQFPISIKVITPSGNSNLVSFTYHFPNTPTVTSISPPSGTTAGGLVVTITGTGFTGATQVLFGTFSALSFVVNSDTKITAVIPPQGPLPASGSFQVDVTVTTPGGTSALNPPSDLFTYTAGPVPAVTSISPTSGPTGGGTVVLVGGTNFTGAIGVTFGGTVATSFTILSDGWLIVTSPPHLAGTVDVQVSTFSGTSPAVPQDLFTYQNGTAPMLAASASPSTSGQWVTFTATIQRLTGTGIPTGTATFRDGRTILQSGIPLDATGRAVFSTSTLSLGRHFITVEYSGASSFAHSMSGIFVHIVNPSSGPSGGGGGHDFDLQESSLAPAIPLDAWLPVARLSPFDAPATKPAGTSTVNASEPVPLSTNWTVPANYQRGMAPIGAVTPSRAAAPPVLTYARNIEAITQQATATVKPVAPNPLAATGPFAHDTSATLPSPAPSAVTEARRNAWTDHIAAAITQADAAPSHRENHARIPGDLFFAALTRRHLHNEDWAWLNEEG
jgi:hypothetical protein